MTPAQLHQKMKDKVKGLSVPKLQEVLTELNKLPPDEDNTLAFDAALDVLMGKMPEAEFVKFCNSLM